MAIVFALSFILPAVGAARLLVRHYPEMRLVETVIAALLFALVVLSAACLAAAVFGVFSLLSVWIILVMVSAPLFVCCRKPSGLRLLVVREYRSLLLAAGLCCLAFFSFSQPAEWLTNYMMDAGRYANSSSLIARNGSVLFAEPTRSVADELQAEDIDRVQGYYWQASTERYVLPYLHLFPSLQAFFKIHVGILNSLKLNWLLGILGCLACYLLLRLLTNSQAGALIGSALFFTNPAVHLYFNRNMTEVLTAVFFLTVIVHLVLLHMRPSRYAAVQGALAWSLLAFCRLEFGVLFGMLAAVCLLVYFATETKPPRYFGLFLLVQLFMLSVVLLYYDQVIPGYVYENTVRRLSGIFASFGYDFSAIRPWGIRVWLGLNALPLLGGLLALSLAPKLLDLKISRSPFINKSWAPVLSLIFGAFLLWNYLARPALALSSGGTYGIDFNHDQFNLVRLSYFVDPFCFLGGLAGLFLLLRDRRMQGVALFIILFTMLVIYQCGHSSIIFWWIRRYIPIVITGFIVFYAFWLAHLKGWQRYALAAVSIALQVFVAAKVARGFTEYAGTYRTYTKLTGMLKEDDLQICFDGVLCNWAAEPLRAHFGVETAYLKRGLNSRKMGFLKRMVEERGRVFITHMPQRGELFQPEDLQVLEQAGLRVRYLRRMKLKPRSIDRLEGGWRKGDPLAKLYASPTLLSRPLFFSAVVPVRVIRLSQRRKR